jgi:hypothetical protein
VSPLGRRVLIVIVGSALFGVVMGLRAQVQPRWAKNSVAGVAGGIMGLTITLARRSP